MHELCPRLAELLYSTSGNGLCGHVDQIATVTYRYVDCKDGIRNQLGLNDMSIPNIFGRSRGLSGKIVGFETGFLLPILGADPAQLNASTATMASFTRAQRRYGNICLIESLSKCLIHYG